MTAPSGPLLFNSSTGSDTQASSLGPATAVFGTTGTCTSGSPTVTGINTTGVVAGNLFWGDTSSGRQFSVIASVDSGTQVTLDDNLAANHSGNLTWAIGGKRATLSNADSYKLLDNGGGNGDMKGGWAIELESGFTDTISVIDWRGDGSLTLGPKILRGAFGAATKPVITFSGSGNGIVKRGAYQQLRDITLASSATKTGAAVVNTVGEGQVDDGLTITQSSTNAWNWGIQNSGNIGTVTVNCEIANCKTDGISYVTGGNVGALKIVGCHIHDNAAKGIDLEGSSHFGVMISDNIIADNGTDGVSIANARADFLGAGTVVKGNIIDGNGGDGLEYTSWATSLSGLIVRENIFSNHASGTGLKFSNASASAAGVDAYGVMCQYNAFYNNSAHRSNVNAGLGDVTLSADPYVDRSNADYNINTDAGGGATLRAVTVTMS